MKFGVRVRVIKPLPQNDGAWGVVCRLADSLDATMRLNVPAAGPEVELAYTCEGRSAEAVEDEARRRCLDGGVRALMVAVLLLEGGGAGSRRSR